MYILQGIVSVIIIAATILCFAGIVVMLVDEAKEIFKNLRKKWNR